MGRSDGISMIATRMNLRIGVDGIDPVRQLGREAWFTVMGPPNEAFKGATLRQGAALGSLLRDNLICRLRHVSESTEQRRLRFGTHT